MLAPIQACNALLDLALEYWKTPGLKSSHEKFKLSILGLEYGYGILFGLDMFANVLGLDFFLSKQSEIKYADCTSSSVAMDFCPLKD